MVRQVNRDSGVRARLRSWPGDPAIRHLVLLDSTTTPAPGDVARWVALAFDGGDGGAGGGGASATGAPARAIRTGAVFPRAAEAFLEAGFREVDRLTLLERDLVDIDDLRRRGRDRDRDRRGPGPGARRGVLRTVRLRSGDLATAAEIDRSSFAAGWSNDVDSLRDIASATPQARLRLVTRPAGGSSGGARAHGRPSHGTRSPRREALGFSITGRAGTTAYLQRLAVRPSARRAGAGRLLVDDALGWAVRRGATRALVNTGAGNDAALELYRSSGFRPLDEPLVVLELDRPR
ncbi:GNAT family N-acetyltransferase [Ilumatobacter sp.]|uniref:GNAT family N-acetyltransferase n=1 Tax=Ilumatobacter sp. TaxID=1967498 RepID=UPI003B522751